MYIITRYGCSSLYTEISIVDSNDTVIGYTNDSVGAVKAGQRAKLTFVTFLDGVISGNLTRIACN
jgi:hypothetical protein